MHDTTDITEEIVTVLCMLYGSKPEADMKKNRYMHTKCFMIHVYC